MRVVGVGVAGLAESGVLLDASGGALRSGHRLVRQARRARSWSRPAARAPFLPEQFSRRTGLPGTARPALAKLLWLQQRRA